MPTERIRTPYDIVLNKSVTFINIQNLSITIILFSYSTMSIEVTTPLGYSTLILTVSIPNIIGLGGY